MDLILINGKFMTMDEDNPESSAIAIKDGLIKKVSSDEEVLKLKTNDTKVIDMGGKCATPGLNDSHLHNAKYAIFQNCAYLGDAKSLDEFLDGLRDFLDKKNLKEGEWLIGRGWNQDYFDVKEFPTRTDLDKVSTEHPILTYRACGHISLVNSKGLEVLGIDENTPQVDRGEFDVETGIFKELATAMIEKPARDVNLETMKEILQASGHDLLKQGITSIQSDDLKHVLDYDVVIQAYIELAKEGKLPIRVYEQCLVENMEELEEFLDNDYDLSGCEGFFELGPIKLLADGSLGARTAALTKPYHDDPSTKGISIYSQEQLDELVKVSHDAGRAVAVHCIGDEVMHMTIESIEKAQKDNPREDARHGIVHCQITDIPLLEKFRDNNIIAYVQPIFLHYDMHILEDRVGKELASTSYNFKRLMDMGVHTTLGTDSPVEKFDTIPNIHSAVNRQDLSKFPEGGYFPEQKLSVEEAIYAYTVESAYSSFDEDIKGRLKEGMYADITVFSQDIFEINPENILDTEIAMTIIDGKVAYEA